MDHLDLSLVPGFTSGGTAGETSGRSHGVPGGGSDGPQHHQQPDGRRLSGSVCISQQVGAEPKAREPRCWSLKLCPLLPPAGRLIAVVEDLGVKLVVSGDSEVVSSSSLVLAVRKVDGTKFPPASVDIYSTDDVQVSLRASSSRGPPVPARPDVWRLSAS